jgi:hypothetical protein
MWFCLIDVSGVKPDACHSNSSRFEQKKRAKCPLFSHKPKFSRN